MPGCQMLLSLLLHHFLPWAASQHLSNSDALDPVMDFEVQAECYHAEAV